MSDRDTFHCAVCGEGPFDKGRHLASHIRMQARHENEDGDHAEYHNRQESESSKDKDMYQEMKEDAKKEKEKNVQMIETSDKPADEPEFEKIRQKNTEKLSEQEKQKLVKLAKAGYTDIEVAPDKDIDERAVK